MTPLINAVKSRNKDVVSLLLDRGAKPDIVNGIGLSALCVAGWQPNVLTAVLSSYS